MSLPDDIYPDDIYRVSQLTHEARDVIETSFKQIWVLGEISNLSRPSSGHLYFSLKDESAQVRCALFRFSRQHVTFSPENGQQVLALAQVSLYEARGDFQLIIKEMQLAGDGALQLAFEKRKAKLAKAGLFDNAHKKQIPMPPKCVGVVTSSTGAALHDILKVLRRRFASLPVIVYPTLVQGNDAATQIANAIETANQRKECDVLIVARGGGSLEDLWPFNEEVVAQAIFASDIPIVSGVGHEVDFTIADFVADVRAATPSAAAESVSPNQQEYQQRLQQIEQQLIHLISHYLSQRCAQLQLLKQQLRHPGDRLREQAQTIDQMELRLQQALKNHFHQAQQQLHQLQFSLQQLTPLLSIKHVNHQLSTQYNQLNRLMQQMLAKASEQITHYSSVLDSISPLKTLQRGYAILQDSSRTVIRSTGQTKPGDTLHATLCDGELECRVVK